MPKIIKSTIQYRVKQHSLPTYRKETIEPLDIVVASQIPEVWAAITRKLIFVVNEWICCWCSLSPLHVLEKIIKIHLINLNLNVHKCEKCLNHRTSCEFPLRVECLVWHRSWWKRPIIGLIRRSMLCSFKYNISMPHKHFICLNFTKWFSASISSYKDPLKEIKLVPKNLFIIFDLTSTA